MGAFTTHTCFPQLMKHCRPAPPFMNQKNETPLTCYVGTIPNLTNWLNLMISGCNHPMLISDIVWREAERLMSSLHSVVQVLFQRQPASSDLCDDWQPSSTSSFTSVKSPTSCSSTSSFLSLMTEEDGSQPGCRFHWQFSEKVNRSVGWFLAAVITDVDPSHSWCEAPGWFKSIDAGSSVESAFGA